MFRKKLQQSHWTAGLCFMIMCAATSVFSQVTAVGGETQVNTVTDSTQKHPAVAMAQDGSYTIVWESLGQSGDADRFGIFQRRYSADGTPLSTGVVNSLTAGNQRYPDIAMAQNGAYVVFWMDDTKDDNTWSIQGRRFDNTGAALGDIFPLIENGTQAKFPKVSVQDNGDMVVVFAQIDTSTNTFSIRSRRITAAGVNVEAVQTVATSNTNFLGFPDVARDSDGDYVVVWQEENTDGSGLGIYARRYNSSAVAQGAAFKVNTTTAGNQQEPAIAMDVNGNFIVAWTSFGQDGDKGGIYAQRYLANGTPNGVETQINTTTTNSQDNVAVTMTTVGAYTLAWNSYAQDGSFDGVYLRAFAASGAAIGAEIKVNTRTTDFQQFAELAQYGSTDTLVVVWQDGLRHSSATHDGDDYGIYKQRYSTVSELMASAGPDTAICLGDSVQIGGAPSGAGGVPPYTYSWSPATGLSSASAANPTAMPTDTTEYILTVTDDNSDTAMDTVLVIIKPIPVVDAGADTSICLGESVVIGGGPTASGGTGVFTYAWTPTTGLDDATIANPTATPTDTTTYVVTVTDADGCVVKDSLTVTTHPLPIVDAGADTSICLGESVALGGAPTASDGTAPFTYSWSPAASLNDASLANPTATPTDTTEYIVTVTDANNCVVMDTIVVTTFPLPVVDAGADTAICLGESVDLGGAPTASGGTEPYTYAWTPAASLNDASLANPTATPTDTTEYIVTVTDANNCVVMDTIVVTTLPLPIADAGDDQAICLGDSVTIGGTPTAAGGTAPFTYSWTPIAGLSDATVANPKASPADTTEYIVTITDANGKTDMDTMIVVIQPLVVADAGADKSICLGESTVIGGVPTAAEGTGPFTYSWSPATGLDDASLANPTATPTDTTEYIVTVTDVHGKTDMDTMIVVIQPLAAADAGPDQAICLGDSVQIGGSPTATGGTAPFTYSWSPATGLDDATLANPMASPADTTEYIVTVTDFNGKTAMDTMVVVIQPLAVADAGADKVICIGESTVIGGAPTAAGGTAPFTYSWGPATGLDDATLANPTASPTDTTEYIVTITDANGKTDMDTMIVTVQPLAVADAGADQAICAGESVQIGGSPTAAGGTGPFTYSWSPAGGLDDASLANPTASLGATTAYIVTLTDFNGKTDMDTVLVTVHPNPVVNAGADVEVCFGESVAIGGAPTASGGLAPYAYSWSPATGLDNASISNPTASPTVDTEYIVTVTDDNNCVTMDTIFVTVLPLPIVNAGADQTICVGDNVVIGGAPTATGGNPGYTYSWSPALGLDDATLPNPTASPTDTTTYIVTVTDSKNCVSTDTMTVNVQPLPVADAGPDVAVCADDSVQIGGSPTASVGAPPFAYSWSPIIGLDDPTAANPMASPAGTTTYTVTVTDDNGKIVNDDVEVTIYPRPTAHAGPDVDIVFGGSTSIGGSPSSASGGTAPYTYSWTPVEDLDDPTLANPTASPFATTDYILTVTDVNGCTGSDTMTVTVFDNVFLSNGDIVIEGTKHVGSAGVIHSNANIIFEKGDPSEYDVDLTAVDDIEINKEVIIDGDATAGGAIDLDDEGTITGSQNAGASVSPLPLPTKSYTAGGADHDVPEDGSLTLAPGSYGEVTLEQNSTLFLQSGDYFFEELVTKDDPVVFDIDVSGGPITVNVVNDLGLGHEIEIRLPNGEADSDLVTFCTLQSGEIELGREAYFLGTLIAVNADVVMKKNTQLRGGIYAESILIESDCLFLAHNSPGSLLGPGLAKTVADAGEVNRISLAIPDKFELYQNYPNPFNPTTTIRFDLPETREIKIAIYNSVGQLVRTLVADEYAAGQYETTWDARDESGVKVASGMYIYVIRAGQAFTSHRKLLLMK